MINEEYDNLIRKWGLEMGRSIMNRLFHNKKNKYLIDYINQRFPQLDSSYNIGTRIYWIVNHIEDFPKCANLNCNNKVLTKKCNFPSGYLVKYCSSECAGHDINVTDRKMNTKLKRYGSSTYNNRTKASDTILRKYGVDNISKSIETIVKIQEKKYGKVLTEEEIDRLKKLLEYDGKKYTNEDKDFFIFLKEELPNIDPKERYSRNEKIRMRSRVRNYKNMVDNWKFFEPMFDVYTFLKYKENSDELLKWKCKKCGNIFLSSFNNHYKEHLRCLKCNPYNHGHSSIERDMQDYISSVVDEKNIIRNDRKTINPLEIDCFVKTMNIGFEMDGLYQHCDLTKNDTYHLDKTEICGKKGIKLYHIFEDEWNERKLQCKWMIDQNLGRYEIIPIEKCSVLEIDNRDSVEFQNKNMIKGYKNGKFTYGIFKDGDLLFVCSISKTRNDNSFTVDRFGNKIGVVVENALDACLSEFRKTKNEDVFLRIDRRLGTIENLRSFEFIKNTKPNFYYVNYGFDYRINRENRNINFWSSELNSYDYSKTLEENIKDNKYSKIYDCGSTIMKYKN